MKTQSGNAQEIRNNALAGIAVMNEDVSKAEELLAAIDAPGELKTFEGNRFATFAAVDDEALDGLTDFQAVLEKSKLRYCLALSVPVSEMQTEPILDASGSAFRVVCSANGLPFRTQSEQQDGRYKYKFVRPSFWLVKVVADGDKTMYYATLFGQYPNELGQLVYRPFVKKSFDAESKSEVEKPITKVVEGGEKAAQELNINERFLYAMVRPLIDLAQNQLRRQGLRASVHRVSVAPLTSTIGETFPGLEALKIQLQAEEAPADSAPVKKAKKAKKAEVATV
mgnify:FL=1